MAAPTVVGVGAVATATTAITPPFPVEALADNDVLIGIGESVGGEAYFSGGAPPTGWAHVPGSPINVDTSTRLTVIWKRFVSGDTAPSWGDSGNHNVARIIAVRGVLTSGDPWGTVTPTTGQETAANASAEFPTLTTAVADCLIVFCIATGRDLATTANLAALSGGTGLSSAVERMDNWIASGTGGGIGMITAIKATAGTIGAATATMGSTDSKALMTIALEPGAGAVVGAVTATITSASTVTAVVNRVGTVTATTTAGSTLSGLVGPVGPVRQFDGVDDFVRLSSGGISGLGSGAWSIAVLIKKPATGFGSPFHMNNAATPGTNRLAIETGNAQWFAHVGGAFATLTGAVLDDIWQLAIHTKAAGSAQVRSHYFNYNTSAWTHGIGGTALGNATNSADSIQIGRFGTSDEMTGKIAAVAAYDFIISDAEAETMEAALQAWADLAPVGLWPLNQASVGTPIEDLIGTADQAAITGTTVVDTDAPIPFDFEVSGGALTGAITSTTTAGSIVTGAIAATGAVTATTTTTSTVTAVVGRLGAVTATTTAGSTVTAASAGKVGAVTATITAGSTVTGVVNRVGAVTATTTSTSTVTASTVSGLIGAVTSTMTVGSTVTAVVARFGAVTATTTAGITTAAVVARTATITSTTTATSTITAVVALTATVTSTTTTTSMVAGVRGITAVTITATITAGSTVTAIIPAAVTRGLVQARHRPVGSTNGRTRATAGVSGRTRPMQTVSGG